MKLACDALEGLAAIAVRRGRLAEGRDLLACTDSGRELTGYSFRFGFEQTAIDAVRPRAWAPGNQDGTGGGAALASIIEVAETTMLVRRKPPPCPGL